MKALRLKLPAGSALQALENYQSFGDKLCKITEPDLHAALFTVTLTCPL